MTACETDVHFSWNQIPALRVYSWMNEQLYTGMMTLENVLFELFEAFEF